MKNNYELKRPRNIQEIINEIKDPRLRAIFDGGGEKIEKSTSSKFNEINRRAEYQREMDNQNPFPRGTLARAQWKPFVSYEAWLAGVNAKEKAAGIQMTPELYTEYEMFVLKFQQEDKMYKYSNRPGSSDPNPIPSFECWYTTYKQAQKETNKENGLSGTKAVEIVKKFLNTK